jgi:xanthine dehydrogenase small subunit
VTVAFRLDGRAVSVADGSRSLLDALREELGVRAPKDGCSPQGQCGCCTVWVDGAPRVSCVTPVRRVDGREVTTAEGLPEEVARRWAGAMVATGASQCGFCTPGIVMRLAGLEAVRRSGSRQVDEGAVRTALAAHLCRCTGWQSIVEAAGFVLGVAVGPPGEPAGLSGSTPRDPLLSAWRAQIEGPGPQSTTTDTVLGRAGFADDTAPAGAAVAVPRADGTTAVGADLTDARRRAGKVQGRNSPVPLRHPLEVPPGEWALTLRTTWVEPAYLEPDASWCVPGGAPATPLANGGAFGGKRRSPVPEAARRLAAERGGAVRVVWSREDVARNGPKRPPVAAGVRSDGTGVLRIARTPGATGIPLAVERIAASAPGLAVEVVDVAGPVVSSDLRGAGWAEAAVIGAVLEAVAAGGAGPGAAVEVTAPGGGRARAAVAPGGPVRLEVWAGEALDEVVLRSYCMGAVHQALGWVRSEGVAVDEAGRVQDLTVRSYGVLPARDTPWMHVTIHEEDRWPVNGSDAVLAATAAAAWLTEGLPQDWPTRRPGGGK